MRFIALFALVALLMGAIVVNAQETKSNFSGEWTPNAEKSDQGAIEEVNEAAC